MQALDHFRRRGRESQLLVVVGREGAHRAIGIGYTGYLAGHETGLGFFDRALGPAVQGDGAVVRGHGQVLGVAAQAAVQGGLDLAGQVGVIGGGVGRQEGASGQGEQGRSGDAVERACHGESFGLVHHQRCGLFAMG